MTEFADLLAHLTGDRCAQCANVQAASHPPNACVRVFRRRSRQNAGPVGVEALQLRESLGGGLAQLRAETGLSQWRLAVLAGVPRSTVERLESGRRRPTPSMLASLVAAAFSPGGYPVHQQAVLWLSRLAEGVGAGLVADTPGGIRRRARRLAEAQRRARWREQQAIRAAAMAEMERRRAFMAETRLLARAQTAEQIMRVMSRLRNW